MFGITFTQASQALSDAQSVVSMGEAHGCLCGALCVNDRFQIEQWIAEVQADDVELDPAMQHAMQETLQGVYRDTVRALQSQDMEFRPFLPDDDSPLASRVEALAQWCEGFLYGFGAASSGPERRLSDEVDEVLRDIAKIARASVGDTEPTDEDEADYTEIVEYIRAGVQLVHDELHPSKPATPLQ